MYPQAGLNLFYITKDGLELLILLQPPQHWDLSLLEFILKSGLAVCSECYLIPRLKYLVSETELAGFAVVFTYLEVILLKHGINVLD